jgi:hypothetical protein
VRKAARVSQDRYGQTGLTGSAKKKSDNNLMKTPVVVPECKLKKRSHWTEHMITEIQSYKKNRININVKQL